MSRLQQFVAIFLFCCVAIGGIFVASMLVIHPPEKRAAVQSPYWYTPDFTTHAPAGRP